MADIPDFVHFEQHVAKLFKRWGWTVETAKTNQPGYDLIVKRGNYTGAVQVKWLNNNVSTPQLLKFANFLDTQAAKKQFNCGFFITTKGFGGPARALIKSWGNDVRIGCGIATESDLQWERGFSQNEETEEQVKEISSPNNNHKKLYFGVFTCKGGVGKTTVAAHLAGALALQGFDIALVDLDPEENLLRLVGDGVYVPNSGGVGNTIEVFKGEDWHEDSARNCKIIICDCSPALERNPKELIEKFDYCIIPTTLNPLGINKHGKVIKDTVREIRNINPNAHLFVLVNQFKQLTTNRFNLLRRTFLNVYQEISQTDDKFHCIDPEEVHIRSSDLLYYWGIHLLEDPDNPRSELAFQLVGGRCYPRDDFINLADYIERQTQIEHLRG
ncbi:restriction endonuclease [Rippkaea orientalis PCC 8801]|uniref:Restriction endonuclease n=1 Tax=Rippkaea orientalis (strain PCC 8801 / RF-1) TaxID=41431 RepID=B7K3D8_RIPO1|nr:AAA family ATPase [Rippkaea orientalis]ACK64458.1 restriction endonuclease [Rippkaea orientalis PCC 8801]